MNTTMHIHVHIQPKFSYIWISNGICKCMKSKCYFHLYTVEPFTPDTIGTTVSVLISGVSLFQGLILYTFVCICGKTKCPDLRGVRSEGFHCMYLITRAV